MQEMIKKFSTETVNNAYEFLGSFMNGKKTVFRVWAPNAKAVSVVGDFNDWNCSANYMYNIGYGFWETEIQGLKNFDVYKYAVVRCDGSIVLKSDPYARHFETAPSNASKNRVKRIFMSRL